MDGVSSRTDELRNMVEILIGMNFTVCDLLKIQHELDPHYPSSNCVTIILQSILVQFCIIVVVVLIVMQLV